jgi:hypothetical protein
MALGRLGTHQGISSLNDPGQLAGTCRQFFDQARRSLLADYDWPFAKVLIPLQQTGNTAPPPWAVEYARPACVKVRALAVPQASGPINVNYIPSGSASSIDFGGAFYLQGGQAYQGLAQPNMSGDPSPTVIPFTTGAILVRAVTSSMNSGATAPSPPPTTPGGGPSSFGAGYVA